MASTDKFVSTTTSNVNNNDIERYHVKSFKATTAKRVPFEELDLIFTNPVPTKQASKQPSRDSHYGSKPYAQDT